MKQQIASEQNRRMILALVYQVLIAGRKRLERPIRTAELASIGGRPAMGCVLTKLVGSRQDLAPSFVDLMQGRPLVRNSARPGFLGPTYQPFRPDMSDIFSRPLEEGMKKELVAGGAGHATSRGYQ